MNIGNSFEHVATELETVKAKVKALEKLLASEWEPEPATETEVQVH